MPEDAGSSAHKRLKEFRKVTEWSPIKIRTLGDLEFLVGLSNKL